MSVLLDEETVVLEQLDFRERCDAKGEHPADVATRFRCCDAGALLCNAHVRNQRDGVDALIARGRQVQCGYCGAEFTISYDANVEVVPL